MSADDNEKYLVSKPAYEVVPPFEDKGRQGPAMTLMSNNLVPGSNMYVEAGWIYSMPEVNPAIGEHTHNYDEIVLHIGIDPHNPEDLGAEIEFCMNGQPLMINKTSAVFVPKGAKHGPLTWKKVDKAHLEMTIMIGAGRLAEADPGGHLEKMAEIKGAKR